MKITFVTTRYGEGLGGKENYLVALARALVAAGHAVRVLTRAVDAFPELAGDARFTSRRPPVAYTGPDGIEVRTVAPRGRARQLVRPAYRLHFYRSTFWLAAWLFARALAPELAESIAWADIVHYDGTGRELLGYAAAEACRVAGRRMVVCPHLHAGRWGDSAPDLALYRGAAGVIAKTQVEAAVLEAGGVARDRVAVIGNGPHLPAVGDPDQLAKRLGHPGPYVLFVGRRTEAKGYPVLRSAMERVWSRFPKVHLLALSPADDVQRAAHRDKRVHELPAASEADKDAAYRLAQVLALPSEAEAFGMVIVEAWSRGVPVVVSRIPTLEEIVTEGITGRLVEPTVEPLAAALIDLLDRPDAAREMGAAGRAVVERDYRWDAIAQATLALYERARG